MAEPFRMQFNQGYVSSRDETELEPGELVSGVGAFYKPGDPTRIWKEQGRQLFYNVPSSGVVDGLELLVFDEGRSSRGGIELLASGALSDRIVSLVSGNLWYTSIQVDEADLHLSGLLHTAEVSGVRPDQLHRVHWNDVHYVSILNGRPFAIEPNTTTSGNIRRMGMIPPDDVPISSGAASATFSITPTAARRAQYHFYRIEDFCTQLSCARPIQWAYDYAGRFNDAHVLNAGDDDIDTFAYAVIDRDRASRAVTYYDFPANSGTNRRLYCRFQVTRRGGSGPSDGDIGVATSLGEHGVVVHIHAVYNPDQYTPYITRFQRNHPDSWENDDYFLVAEDQLETYAPANVNRGARLLYENYKLTHERPVVASVPIPDGYNTSGLEVYISFAGAKVQYSDHSDSANSASGVQNPTIIDAGAVRDSVLRVYDLRVTDGSTSAVFGAPSGVRYAVSEFDSTRGLESVPGPQSSTLVFSDLPGAQITLPSGTNNPNTTDFKIYRSNLPNGDPVSGVEDNWNNFGLVGQVPFISGQLQTFVDEFRQFPISVQPIPLVSTIQVDGDDQTSTFYLRDRAPVAMGAMVNFDACLAGIDVLNSRTLRYNYAGYAESWPDIYVIDAFPLQEQDSLVGLAPVSNVLVVLAKGAVMTVGRLPQIRQGRMDNTDIDKIDGAPGCVGPYAVASIQWDNFPAVAYVSIHGVYMTDGHSAVRLTDDLDWAAEVNEDTLYKSSLFYDKAYRILYFSFDKDGDGFNDHYFLLHLDRIHRKQNGMPKITGPTPAKLTKLVGGQINNAYRIFSGSSVNSKLFEERVGFADASNSYTVSGILPFDVKTGRTYANWEYWSVIRSNLRHTDWGDESLNITWTAGRDDNDQRQNVTRVVSLDGNRGHEFSVNRNGDWHQVRMTHETSGNAGGIHHMKLKATTQGDSGDR